MMAQMMRSGYTVARSKRTPRRNKREDPVRADCNKGRSLAIGGGSAVEGMFWTVPAIVVVADMAANATLCYYFCSWGVRQAIKAQLNSTEILTTSEDTTRMDEWTVSSISFKS